MTYLYPGFTIGIVGQYQGGHLRAGREAVLVKHRISEKSFKTNKQLPLPLWSVLSSLHPMLAIAHHVLLLDPPILDFRLYTRSPHGGDPIALRPRSHQDSTPSVRLSTVSLQHLSDPHLNGD